MSSWRPTRHPVASRVKRLLHQYRSRHARGGRKAVRSRAAHIRPEAERLFNALSEKAEICMPFAETFWALRFAMLVDQFRRAVDGQLREEGLTPSAPRLPTPDPSSSSPAPSVRRASWSASGSRGSAGVRVAWAHAFDNTLQTPDFTSCSAQH
jgi:hypothetical protein